jgi:hypothetical protein
LVSSGVDTRITSARLGRVEERVGVTTGDSRAARRLGGAASALVSSGVFTLSSSARLGRVAELGGFADDGLVARRRGCKGGTEDGRPFRCTPFVFFG